MAAFVYQGRNDNREAVTGTLDGESTSDVARQLAALGIAATDVRLKPVEQIAHAGPSWFEKLNRQAITEDDIILFSRQMYTLQKAGVPILRAFAGLQESTEGVIQGAKESSNVHPAQAMVEMILGSRFLDASQRVLRAIAESIQLNTRPTT